MGKDKASINLIAIGQSNKKKLNSSATISFSYPLWIIHLKLLKTSINKGSL